MSRHPDFGQLRTQRHFTPLLINSRPAKCLLAVGFLLLSACVATPVKKEPFQQYLEAVSLVAKSADGVISREYQQELDEYERRFKTGEETDITRLFLQPTLGQPFAMDYPAEPGEQGLVFLAIADQRQKLQAVNQLAIQYAAFLVRIVGAETGKFDVDQQAKSLNAQAAKFLSGNTSALISTAFVAAAKQYIEQKRRDKLSVLLSEGQPVIEAYSQLGTTIARTAASTLTRNYDHQFAALVHKNKKNVDGVLALNKRLLEQMEVLRQLDLSYVALVDNHARLKIAVDADGDVSFVALIEQAKSLKALYSKLKP